MACSANVEGVYSRGQLHLPAFRLVLENTVSPVSTPRASFMLLGRVTRPLLSILTATCFGLQFSNFDRSSARLLFREFPELKKELWGGHFWSPSYFLASVGEVKLEDVKRYVQSQGDT